MGIKKYSLEEEKQIADEYIKGASVKSLMSKYGFKTKKSISDKVKKVYPDNYKRLVNIARNNRKEYNIDLSVINNEFNAYLLGLLLTDGYIQDNNRFGLQLTDEDCIQFIAQVTGKTYCKYTSKDKCLPQYRIIFSDGEQVGKMQRLGVVKNKSYVIQPPQLQEEEMQYIPYIIRGIIDGDGCIYTTTKGSAAFNIATMSLEFATWIKDMLENKLFMKDISLHQQSSGIWIVDTALQYNIFKLIALVYDKPFGMYRKFNKLRETFRDYNLGNQDFLLG